MRVDIHDQSDFVAHAERTEEGNAFRAGAPYDCALPSATNFVEPRAPHPCGFLEAFLEDSNIPDDVREIVLGVELRSRGRVCGPGLDQQILVVVIFGEI